MCLYKRPLLFFTVLNVWRCLSPTGSGVGRFVGCAALDCTSFYAVIPSLHTNNPDILYAFILAFCALVPPIRFLENSRARACTHTGSSKEYNVTSLSLHSLIIRGDGWFSGFLRISTECYRMRMDSFRAVCLPSALSLRRHSRLAHFQRACSAKISIQYHPESPFT